MRTSYRPVSPRGVIRAAALAPLLMAAACAAPATLAYQAPATVNRSWTSPIAGVVVVDERGVPDAFIGAVMGPDGKPLKRLITATPVGDEVAGAFGDALVARGAMQPPPGSATGSDASTAAAPTPVLPSVERAPFELHVMLLQINAEQNAERQGGVDMVIRLVERTSGREVYSRRIYLESRGTNYLAVDSGVFGSPAALNRIANGLLSQAIDTTLDSAGFRRALRA
jgi:hypothetical protein